MWVSRSGEKNYSGLSILWSVLLAPFYAINTKHPSVSVGNTLNKVCEINDKPHFAGVRIESADKKRASDVCHNRILILNRLVKLLCHVLDKAKYGCYTHCAVVCKKNNSSELNNRDFVTLLIWGVELSILSSLRRHKDESQHQSHRCIIFSTLRGIIFSNVVDIAPNPSHVLI